MGESKRTRAGADEQEPARTETDKAEKATAAEKPGDLVRVKANPKLFRGGIGQVVVGSRTVTTAGVEVTRAEADKLCLPEIRGLQAVVAG